MAGAVAALELPDFIFSGKPRVADLVASSVIAKAVVLGSAVTSTSAFDVAREEVAYAHNGETVQTYTAAEVMGNPPGDLVMSGAISNMLRPKVGDTIRATFAHLGSVSLKVVP